MIAAALGNIARAKGMAQIAKETGLGRESLYKALSPEGKPQLASTELLENRLFSRAEGSAECRKQTCPATHFFIIMDQ